MGDYRVAQISNYLRSGKMSRDALRAIAYAIEVLEKRGELEMFVSDEIDRISEELD